MRCRGCDYELWSMKPGACPECGRLWRFDEFRFRPLAAQFLCPHCDHPYAGTDEQGLPTPRAFICVNCTAPIDLDQMRALPAPGTDGSGAMDDEHAWSERARLGYWRAFWRTVGQSMGSPSRIGATLPQRSDFWGAVLFATICGMIGIFFSGSPLFVLFGLASGQMSSGLEYALRAVGTMAGVIVGFVIVGQLLFLLWGCAAHGILRVGGGVRRPIVQSMSTTLYCSGPFIISAVPCCGIYIFPISFVWMAIGMIHAFASLHRISVMRASVAVLTPVLAFVAAIVLAIAGMIWISGNSTWSTNSATFSTQFPPSPTAVASPAQPPADPSAEQSDPQVLPTLGPEAPEK